jgi:hypothetical protein
VRSDLSPDHFPRPDPQWQIRQVIIFRLAALFNDDLGFENASSLAKILLAGR